MLRYLDYACSYTITVTPIADGQPASMNTYGARLKLETKRCDETYIVGSESLACQPTTTTSVFNDGASSRHTHFAAQVPQRPPPVRDFDCAYVLDVNTAVDSELRPSIECVWSAPVSDAPVHGYRFVFGTKLVDGHIDRKRAIAEILSAVNRQLFYNNNSTLCSPRKAFVWTPSPMA